MTTVVRRTPLHAATVVDARDLTPRMRRITLHAPTMDEPRPAQDIELVLTDDTGRKVKRRYTITHFRDGHFDVDALRHGTAPGAGWATTTQPGDEVRFFGPRGKLALRDAAWHLFVGDESALPAFAELAATVRTPAYALIEVDDADDELPVDAEVRWLHRAGPTPGDATPPGTSELLGAALDGYSPPPGDGHAYLLGESRVVAALRPRLHALGLGNEQLYVKGYWNVGRTGLVS
jgi:NADPH-dependent ferric siderophore reductase